MSSFSQASAEELNSIGTFDVGRIRDAQHCVMGGVEGRIDIRRGVGRDEWQVAGVGKLDQCVLGGFFSRIAAAGDFDVEATGKECLQPIQIGLRFEPLSFGKQPCQSPLGSRGQGDKTVRQTLELVDGDMRVFLDRTVEVSRRNELTEVCVALVILCKQNEPVDRLSSAEFRRPCDGEHRPDDRLDAFREAGVAERHDAIETVAIRDRNRREAKLCRALGDDFRLHRSFEHCEA